MHYQRILEEAVSFVRAGGGNAANRVPIGEAFMTTHSFAVDRLEDEYDTRVREYAEGNETVLAACRAVVSTGEQRRYNPTSADYVQVLYFVFHRTDTPGCL